MKSTLEHLLVQLNHGLVEREDVFKSALLAVLARENLLLIGPPGTGKSMIARSIAGILAPAEGEQAGHFEYLLTKFSTPEEIFGPLSIAALKLDCFSRNTAGYLPTVQIAFLDEIFKASSSILNALLTILNEKLYHNGAQVQQVPLRSLIAASNELPADQDELAALYDRFLVRRYVDYVSHDKLAQLFEEPGPAPSSLTLHPHLLASIEQDAGAVTIPPAIVDAVQRIWSGHREMFKEDRRESLSDRRLKKAIRLMRVSAATNERAAVDLSDVFLLKDCLWNHPDNALKVRELVMRVLAAASGPAPARPIPSPSAPVGATIRGLEGRGTASQPFLIGSVEDLMRLERPEIGRKGYHFLQTADIDCSSLSAWMQIGFQGSYDGAGHTISYAPSPQGTSLGMISLGVFGVSIGDADSEGPFAVFSRIEPRSAIRHLVLDKLGLCETAQGAIIERCASLGRPLIFDTASDCTILDCLVELDLLWRKEGESAIGPIAHTLTGGTTVERCFVHGKVRGYYSSTRILLHGIAQRGEDVTINACAIGMLELEERFGTIKHPLTSGAVQLTNNTLLDVHTKWDYLDRNACKRIPASLFARPYFENTMDWDFDTVWQWDAASRQPSLRKPAPYAPADRNNTDAPDTADLLTRQLRANLWV